MLLTLQMIILHLPYLIVILAPCERLPIPAVKYYTCTYILTLYTTEHA